LVGPDGKYILLSIIMLGNFIKDIILSNPFLLLRNLSGSRKDQQQEPDSK